MVTVLLLQYYGSVVLYYTNHYQYGKGLTFTILRLPGFVIYKPLAMVTRLKLFSVIEAKLSRFFSNSEKRQIKIIFSQSPFVVNPSPFARATLPTKILLKKNFFYECKTLSRATFFLSPILSHTIWLSNALTHTLSHTHAHTSCLQLSLSLPFQRQRTLVRTNTHKPAAAFIQHTTRSHIQL